MDADLDPLCIAFIARPTICCPAARQRAPTGERRRGGHPLRRPGAHGDPHRPPLPGRGPAPARPSVPAACPSQAGLHKRRAPPRRHDRVADRCLRRPQPRRPTTTCVLLDSTPVECGRSLETTRRSAAGRRCGYGYCRSHSRWFWGMRLHLVCAPDGTPRAASLTGADRPEREVALALLPAASAAARRSSATRATPATTSTPPSPSSARIDRAPSPPETSPQRPSASRRSASASSRSSRPSRTCSTLERHGARTLANLARPDRHPPARARGLHLPQPPARPTEPRLVDYTA